MKYGLKKESTYTTMEKIKQVLELRLRKVKYIADNGESKTRFDQNCSFSMPNLPAMERVRRSWSELHTKHVKMPESVITCS